LHLALDRALGADLDASIRQNLLAPLGMTSTVFPQPNQSPNGQLAGEYKARAVQGYAEDGKPVGEPGDQQGYYDWPGTGQVYASARDMAQFLAASLGERPLERSLAEAMTQAQRAAFRITPRNSQGLGWEIIHEGALDIVEKNGGLDNHLDLYRHAPGAKARHRDPEQSRRPVSVRSRTLHHARPRPLHQRMALSVRGVSGSCGIAERAM